MTTVAPEMDSDIVHHGASASGSFTEDTGKTPTRSRPSTVLAAVLLAVFLAGAGGWELLSGRAVPIWDANAFYAPAYILVADHARAGELLLWNPWINGGRPDHADPQIGAFSPLTVGLGWLTGGTVRGFVLYWFFLWWLGGVGVLLLGKHLGAPFWGRCIAAVGFVTSGFFLTHAQHTTLITSFASLPWVVWRVDVALRSRRALPACQAAAIWGLSALAGYPGMVILTGAYVGLWSLGCAVLRRSEPPGPSLVRRLAWACAVLLIVVTLGGLVLSPTYLAFFTEGAGYSDRVERLSREIAVESNALHPGALATFASPYVAIIKVLNRELWSYTDPSSTSIYLCAGVWILAIGSLAVARGSMWTWWLLAVGLLFLAAAMGRALPVRGWLYDAFVPFRFFRHSAVFRAYFLFSMVVLALYETRSLAGESTRGARRHWQWLLGVAVALSALAAFAFGRLGTLAVGSETVWMVVAWGGAVAACAAGIWKPGWLPQVLAILLCGTLVDGGHALRVSQRVMSQRDIRAWSQVERDHDPRLTLGEKGLERLFKSPYGFPGGNLNLVAKVPVLSGYDPLRNLHATRWLAVPELRRLALGQQRIWFASAAALLPAGSEALLAFEEVAKTTESPPIAVHRSRWSAGPARGASAFSQDRRQEFEYMHRILKASPGREPLSVEVRSYEPNRLSLSFEAPGNGWVLVTDRYAPGWKATLNGSRAEVYKGDFIFRAVAVKRGTNVLVFRYEPRWLLLVPLSWSALAVVLLASVWRWARDRLERRSRVRGRRRSSQDRQSR